MIGRDAMVGTFPDPATCLVAFAVCATVAAALVLIGVRSWLKGE